MNNKRFVPIGIFILAVSFFQITASLAGKEYFLTQLTMTAYYVIVVLGLSALLGYTGQISLGHAAFFAIGGYTTAVLTTKNLMLFETNNFVKIAKALGITCAGQNIYGNDIIYLSPWISLLAAVIITAIISFLIGIPILRLKGHYLAMATLGFGIIIYRILLGTSLFGEADGISDIPSFSIIPGLVINGDASNRIQNYYIAWMLVITVLVLLVNLVNSRPGRGLRAIHGSETAASAMGVNTSGYKLFIFVMSAVLSAIAGVFLTHFNGGIGPSEAGVMKSVRYVAIVAVGGMANLWGVLITGIILNFISLRGYLGSYDDIFFGLILIFIIMFYPDGIIKKEYFYKFTSIFKAKINLKK